MVWGHQLTINALFSQIRMKPEKCSRVIVACAVLFNLAKMRGEPDVQEDEEIPETEVMNYNGPHDGRSVRDHITNTFFH